MTNTYQYKKAPLGRTICLTIDDRGATLGTAGRAPSQEVQWDRVTFVRHGEITVRGLTSRWLDVHYRGGRFRLPCNTHESEDPTSGDLGVYHSAVVAVLRQLEKHGSDVHATLGLGSGWTWAFFGIGAFAFVLGVGLPILAWLTGRPSSKVLPALVPCLLLVIVGVSMLYQFVPWREKASMSLDELAAMHGG